MSTKTAKQQTRKRSATVKKSVKRAPLGTRAGVGGVVLSYVHPSKGKPSTPAYSPATLVGILREGLPMQELEDLQTTLDVPKAKLADLLGISLATLHRRRAGMLLGPAESDRIVRFARLMGLAVEVFESEQAARRWLNSPQTGLGGEVPLVFARTEVGAREVENLLGRIEYGVYS